MFELGEQLTGFDPAGAVMLPGWLLVIVAALVVFVCALVAVRSGVGFRPVSTAPIGVAFIIAIIAAWMLDHLAARDLAAERSAIEARAFELRMHALASGSALGCLEPAAGEVVQEACDKALFASPENVAAAVSYVTAQVSLLAAGRKHAQASGVDYLKLMTPLRRTIEADRFGMVAHLFATHGCGPAGCDLFALLQETTRVKANLADNTFDSHLKAHMAQWPSAGSRSVASNAAPASSAPVAITVTKPASNVFFPSASSIPPVSIMVAEPAAPSQQKSHETTAAPRAGQTPPPTRQAAPSVELRQPTLADHHPPGTADARPPAAAETRQPPPPETRAPSTAETSQTRSAPLQLVPQSQ
jgi:hypothetical protein